MPAIERTIEERNALVEKNIRLVYWVLNKMFKTNKSRKYLSRDDAKSVAMMGLLSAATDFDPSRGYKFSTLAVKYIFNAIRRASFNETVIRIPEPLQYASIQAKDVKRYNLRKANIMVASSVKRLHCLSEEEIPKAEDFDQKYDVATILDCREFLNQLTLRQKMVIESIFFYGRTLKEVGELIGLSKARAAQIRDRALRMLQDMFDKSARGLGFCKP